MKNHSEAKGLSRHLVWALVLVAGACGSSGGGGGGGNGGSQSSGHGGTTGAGGSGAAGTQGSAGTGGSSTAGTGGATGSGGSAGVTGAGGSGGSAGATGAGGSGGSAGTGGSGGTGTGGTAGATGRGGSGGGQAGRGGAGGSGGTAGGAGGRGGAGGGTAGAGGNGGTGGGNTDGGNSDAVVVMDGATMNGVYVRTAWTATYTCTGTCPAQDAADTADADTKRAFDGTLATRWSTGQYQQSNPLMMRFPLYFTVDMHETVNISRIVMDPGNQDHFDAPGQMDVLVSLDGTNYTTIVSAHKPMTPSNGMPDDIMFTRTPARYIQLKATMTIRQVTPTLSDRFWAIGEMNVYP